MGWTILPVSSYSAVPGKAFWNWGVMTKWLWEGGLWCSEVYATLTSCDIVLYCGKIVVWHSTG
ncbi:hypothetical protein [Terasakiella sp.]|uniref:hypothetical protein n=1 Tax=Terasakiella sp. TaxID=2034861 RepID=UPI003AA8D9E2